MKFWTKNKNEDKKEQVKKQLSPEQESQNILSLEKATQTSRISLPNAKFERAIKLIETTKGANWQNQFGNTLLHFISWRNFGTLEDSEKIIDDLILYGANVNIIGRWGESPFFSAIRHGNKEIATYLFEEKAANPNVRNHHGYTPLHMAIFNQMHDLAKLMIAKIDQEHLNLQDEFGKNTPLHVAFNNKKYDLVKAMLEKGADPGIKNKMGITVANQIISSQNQELIIALEEATQETSPLVEVEETRGAFVQTESNESHQSSSGYESSNSSNSLQNSQELGQQVTQF